jgi:ABC-type phosphate/phosphonate transport system substrate-binding protein
MHSPRCGRKVSSRKATCGCSGVAQAIATRCFTAQRAIDDALAQRITAAFTTMRFDDPEHRQVLELEGCKGFIPGTPEG